MLGELAERIQRLSAIRSTLLVPDLNDELNRCLHATCLSFLPEDDFAAPVKLISDSRGWLFELIKSEHFGQILVCRTLPGITRGNHYHDTKLEKFCVIEGRDSMLIAVDTCVLAYAEGVGDEPRCTGARDVIAGLPLESVLLPVQVLGELHRVLTGKAGRGALDVRDAILSWADAFAIGDSTWRSIESAIDLAAAHGLRIWEALILSVASEHKCRLLLSEDFQNGFTWRGVTVVNTFLSDRHPLLVAALQQETGERGHPPGGLA